MKIWKKREGAKPPREITYDTVPLSARLWKLPAIALLLTLLVEWMNRGLSVTRLAGFVVGHPALFLYNALIILTTLLISELFKHRRSVLTMMVILWLVLGVVQFLVTKFRTQPFCSVDILMMKDAFSLITIYFTWPEIILMFGGGFFLVCLVIVLFARMRKRERVNLARSLIAVIGFTAACFMVAALAVRAGAIPYRFDSLVDAYNDYGFPVCFTFTFGQQGISKPDTYSAETVAGIMTDITDDSSDELVYPVFVEEDNLTHPNVVFVQLESFFDVNTLIGTEYTADPTPAFNRLCGRFPSGLLYVPTVGGGTANTEFEVITGLNLDFFGAGEYPYNTILQQTTCETICYDMQDYGYVSTAMHNNTATFYSRNVIYPKLGFDRFEPLEYMQDIHYNALGWAKDASLTDEILTALKTTDERDVIYCVAVETHGKYADTYEYQEGDIEVTGLPEQIPEEAFLNFINILPNSDAFLEKLIRTLVRFNEPTIVVAYGDHLPALEMENDMLSTGSVYASRYVIWNNFGGGFEAPDLQAYRLGANIMKQLGFSGGPVVKLHQSVDASETGEEYLQKLEVLEYDMLYGDQEAFEGSYPYLETSMRLGLRTIAVSDADLEYGRLLVTGENFTEFSKIIVDDAPIETLFVDSAHIIAPVADDAQITRFCVAQIARDGTELSRTHTFRMSRGR